MYEILGGEFAQIARESPLEFEKVHVFIQPLTPEEAIGCLRNGIIRCCTGRIRHRRRLHHLRLFHSQTPSINSGKVSLSIIYLRDIKFRFGLLNNGPEAGKNVIR